jgi:hypothetical protein
VGAVATDRPEHAADLTRGHPVRNAGGPGPVRYWVLAGGQGNEVCVTPPGFAEDGTVRTDPAWLYRWHCGHVSLAQAERAGGMVVTGPRWLHRMLSDWGPAEPVQRHRSGETRYLPVSSGRDGFR